MHVHCWLGTSVVAWEQHPTSQQSNAMHESLKHLTFLSDICQLAYIGKSENQIQLLFQKFKSTIRSFLLLQHLIVKRNFSSINQFQSSEMSRIMVALSLLAILCLGAVQAHKVLVGSSATSPITDQIRDVASRAVALVNGGIQDANSQFTLVNVTEARIQPVAGMIYTLKLLLNTPSQSVSPCSSCHLYPAW